MFCTTKPEGKHSTSKTERISIYFSSKIWLTPIAPIFFRLVNHIHTPTTNRVFLGVSSPRASPGRSGRPLQHGWWSSRCTLYTENTNSWTPKSGWVHQFIPNPIGSMGRFYIYLHENHKNQPNVGKYIIHGSWILWVSKGSKKGLFFLEKGGIWGFP